MIEALLNPSALQKQVDRLQEQTAAELESLASGDPEARRREEEKGSKSDLEQLDHELDEYRKREAQDLSGAGGPVWIPRDPVASLVLSAYDEFLDEFGLVREMPQDKSMTYMPIGVSDRQLEEAAIDFLEGSRRLAGRWLTKYGERDLQFLAWGAAAMLRTSIRGKHAFKETAAPPYAIGNRDRVLLVGDWGSGIPRAQQVAKVMEARLEKSIGESRRCHVIHLGDVYYTGQPREYDNLFLRYWPVKQHHQEDTSSWCLNGNHDMYSGGHGYFGRVLADPRFRRQSGSSFFSLENDHWRILGLDSAYDDGNLHGNQASWLHKTLSAEPQKAGILLSHHQPFSSFEKCNNRLLESVRPTLAADLVCAWFWGHEHRCAAYEQTEKIRYPRVIGHGGVPVWAPQESPPEGVIYQYGRKEEEGFYLYGSERFLRLGFVELTFEDKRIEVRYLNELGSEAKSETLESEP